MTCMVRNRVGGHSLGRVVAPRWQESGHVRIGSIGREWRLRQSRSRQRRSRNPQRLSGRRLQRISTRCRRSARRRELEPSPVNLGSHTCRWSCKLCPDPFLVVNLVVTQERQCFDSFACVSQDQKKWLEKRERSRSSVNVHPRRSSLYSPAACQMGLCLRK